MWWTARLQRNSAAAQMLPLHVLLLPTHLTVILLSIVIAEGGRGKPCGPTHKPTVCLLHGVAEPVTTTTNLKKCFRLCIKYSDSQIYPNGTDLADFYTLPLGSRG